MSGVRQRKQGRPRTRENIGSVRALERGLRVLKALSTAPELSLAELSREVDLPASTAYRILETLRQQSFVLQHQESGRYRLGIRAFEVGSAYLSGERLHEVARPVMRNLAVDLNETVNLAVLDGADAVYVHQVEGQHRRLLRLVRGHQSIAQAWAKHYLLGKS
jgi:IclR family acetate operon transcriptional repressor